jgi:Matrixin
MRRELLLLLLGIAVVPLAGQYHDASAQAAPAHRTVSVSGLKQAGANGVRIEITLDIPPGADTDAIVRDALARRGAQPVTGSDPTALFVLPTLRWPQFVGAVKDPPPVPQYYNPAGDTVHGGALQALQAGEAEWSAVRTTNYAVQYAGMTTRGEAFDGFNTVSWPAPWLDSPNALAVTITTFNFLTGDILDADIIINGQNFQFFANPVDLTPSRFDIRYVLLHENGHVAGLQHSPDPAAVMFAFFSPGIVGHGLAQDDIDAITFLYSPPDYDWVSVDYPGAAFTDVFGANDSGQIVGIGYDALFNVVATFTYDSKKQSYTPIAPLPGSISSFLGGINEPGVMVGSVAFTGVGPEIGLVRSEHGAYTVFSHPAPLGNTEPRAVSNSGLVSGYAYDDAGLNTVGFIYDPARNVFTDFLPSPFTIAQGINNQGQVVGSVTLAAGVACTSCLSGRYGFLRAASGAITYFRVNGQPTSARGISDSGRVTGYIQSSGVLKGFVTTLEGLPYEAITISRFKLLEFPIATLTEPEGITNAGDIVGIWIDALGNDHGFIATPSPPRQ